MAKLEEVAHGMDTQINESLNYNGSCSLERRTLVALGIHSVGDSKFFQTLFKSMNIDITPGFDCYLAMQSRQRLRKRTEAKKGSVKRRRRLRQCKLLQEATARLKLARAKQLGECSAGIAMITEDVPRVKVCSACEEVGHLGSTNKLCQLCKPRQKRQLKKSNSKCPSKTNIVEKDLEQDGEEQSAMDSISFDVAGELTAAHVDITLEGKLDNTEGNASDEEKKSNNIETLATNI